METIATTHRTKNLPYLWKIDKRSPEDFIGFYKENKSEIESKLLELGALKFQNIEIDSTETFEQITSAISNKFLDYIDGNSPRTKLKGSVYTSTEYDKSQKITMHNELSYSSRWPNKLFLSCIVPSETGGETLLADSREILAEMDGKIVKKIRQNGIIYIRNLHGGQGMGPSWQATFETNDKKKLESYLKSYGIDYEWFDDIVRLKQFSKGIINHQRSNQEVWFNQIDQFHPYHLGEEIYEAMKMMHDSPEDFPMYVTYGDGSAIEDSVVKEILETIEALTVAPSWKKNELLIVDNELICHGRSSYTGERRVLVTMSN